MKFRVNDKVLLKRTIKGHKSIAGIDKKENLLKNAIGRVIHVFEDTSSEVGIEVAERYSKYRWWTINISDIALFN